MSDSAPPFRRAPSPSSSTPAAAPAAELSASDPWTIDEEATLRGMQAALEDLALPPERRPRTFEAIAADLRRRRQRNAPPRST